MKLKNNVLTESSETNRFSKIIYGNYETFMKSKGGFVGVI